MATDTTIATEILRQLGGSRFVAMTGAKHVFASDEGRTLQFRLPSSFAKDGINAVRVTLEDSDTYTVRYFRVRGTNVKPMGEDELVYADCLRRTFERRTGLSTSL